MDLQNLQQMSAAKLDELFSDSEAGAIPDGPMEGTVLLSGRRHLAAPPGLLKRIASQGKTFDASRAVLTTRLPLVGDVIAAEVFLGPSWYDQAACIVLDYYPQSVTASRVRDELRQLAPGLYLGKAYEGRRPLIHFALTSTL
jgi:hypothetical protein